MTPGGAGVTFEAIRVAPDPKEYRRLLEQMVADARARPPDPTLAVSLSVDMLALLLGDLAAAQASAVELAEAVNRLATAIAAEFERAAPPKIEGGSPARQQWLADVLAVQAAFHAVGAMSVFVAAMNDEPPDATEPVA